MKVFMVQFLVALVLPYFCSSLPFGDSTTDSLVLVKDATTQNTEETKADPRPPALKSMHVTSNIRNRYGTTVVSSKYANSDRRSQEATFSINLPDTAFISRFVMEIEGKQYEAYVREKEQAKKEYQQAVSQGLGAAHVAVNARDSNKFTVSVNVEPQSKVIFNLTYEELLVRKHSRYEMVINLNPGQLVKDLQVQVNINETRKIVNVETPAIRTGNEILDSTKIQPNKYAVHDIKDDNNVIITFKPSVHDQEEMMKLLKPKEGENNKQENGISGQFVVEYDVERDPHGGEVLINDGYFVHFFAPTDLNPIPKHVVFVLDCSGSMFGRKIEQLREAMKIILGELNENDYFNIVKFHSTVQVLDLNKNNTWTEIEVAEESELPQGFAATPTNIKNAQTVVNEMQDEGLTNIIDALTVGLRMTSRGLPKQQNEKHKPQPIIVFLTDGQANVGESRPKEMIEIIEKRNSVTNKAAIFALSFGFDANIEFLKELALKNSGFSRTIYEAADASLQLQDFYKQISSPLLTNVKFNYSENEVKQLTKHKFDILFRGAELVVAGKLVNPEENEKDLAVEAFTVDGSRNFIPHIIRIPPRPEIKREVGSLERLWAYLTIKQLLDKKYITDDNSGKNTTESDVHEKEALKLALKYSFVTPLTSLVVVKPNKTESLPDEDRPHSFDESSALPLYFAPSGPGQGVAFSNRVSSIQYARPLIVSGLPGVPAPAFQPQYFTTTMKHRPFSFNYNPTTVDSISSPNNQFEINELPWLSSLISDAGELTINNQKYLIGNNQTVVEAKKCQVQSLNLSGDCTLLARCPSVYSKLNTFEIYEEYFCSLDSDKYAGVCCPESKE